MSTTVSAFKDVKNVQYGSQSIGGVMNMKITKTIKRVEAYNNNVNSGPVASGIVGAEYRFNFTSWDLSAMSFLNALTNQQALSVLSFVEVADETQNGTPLGNQLFSLSQCLIDGVDQTPEMKKLGIYSVSGHCMATSGDTDQLTISSSS